MNSKSRNDFADVRPSSDVDWLTATTQNERVAMNWMEAITKYRLEYCLQEMVNPFKMRGFEGFAHGGVRWAFRQSDNRFMIVLSGDAAGDMWAKIVPMGGAKVTRLDLRVDFYSPEDKKGLVYNSYRVPGSEAFDANRMRYSCLVNNLLGQTLYVGSRSSQQMGRLYDKGIQSKACPPGQWFRYEVEAKERIAAGLSRHLARMVQDCPGDVEDWIRTFVHQWFLERWVVPLFSPSSLDGGYDRPSVTITTPQKKLAWLRAQVRPTIAYLFDIGMGDEALDALGLWSRQEEQAMVELCRQAVVEADVPDQILHERR